jgi:hypothetical protein
VNAAAATAATVEPLGPAHTAQTAALLDALRVSLFGIHSRHLHDALVADAVAQRIDCRIALAADEVCGVVLAAPRAYWTSALLMHLGVAVECARARLSVHARHDRSGSAPDVAHPPADIIYDSGSPRRTWGDPGDAWRIIFVGTAPTARGRGVAADLYKSVMRDRSLVARIAADNLASIRLHRSVGWRLYPDGGVVLAVHERAPEFR